MLSYSRIMVSIDWRCVFQDSDFLLGGSIPDDNHAARTSGDVILAVGFTYLGNLFFASAVSRCDLLNAHPAEIGDDRINVT